MVYRFNKNPAHLAGLIGLVVLTACNTTKVDPVAGGGGLAGQWASSDQVYTAHFNNGSFSAIANDTGGILSQGSYIVTSASQVKLNWKGNVTGQANSADCQRPQANILNCVDASGRTFTLSKV